MFVLLAGVGDEHAVFNARGSVRECVDGAWKFTPHTRVMSYLEKKKKNILPSLKTVKRSKVLLKYY
jgi:rRNA processing protein Krr1/Pno1